MRPLALLLPALLVAFSGCLHDLPAAGIPDAVLEEKPWDLQDARTETRAAVAKVQVRSYELSDVANGYAALTVVTVADVPLVTARAVDAAATKALEEFNANEGGTVEVDFTNAGVGAVSATRFTVEQDGVDGTGFRAEFSCDGGYVAVFGVGADTPFAATGGSMFDEVVSFAAELTCDGGDGQSV